LSKNADGVALYEADPVTGAVIDSNGRTRLPGQIGYLKAALDNAKSLGLVVDSADMPGFGETAELTDLSLDLARNYGALLLVNGSEHDLLSSYAAANPFRVNQALTLVAPGRGVSFGFEDKRPLQWGNDHDFNDVIVTLTPAAPTLTGFGIAPAAPSALADSGAAAPAQGTSASSASTSSRAPVRSASQRHANGPTHR
jgi:hypothetical protein